MLTAEERARLDPRVDVEALEEFLARVQPVSRELVLNSFYAEPDPDTMTIVGVIDPEIERLWRRAWRRDGEPTASTGHEAPDA